MTELWKLDATAQANLVRRGEVMPRELVLAALERIDALDPHVAAVVGLDRERALAQADTRRSGPFAGVPFLGKDLLPQPGLRCAFGSRLFAGFVPTEASPYADAVEAAGLITLGKAKSSEFGLLGSTETVLDGPTHNPWSPAHSAGGSSGGSAAAVAAGLVSLAHASDGGGSIRIPAALCGLFGLKPSRGRCAPATPPSDLPDLTIEHCVSRTVRDSAGFLAATEHRAPGAPYEPIGHVVEPSPQRLRIGVYRTTLLGADPPAAGAAAVERAAAVCEELGHTVVDTPPPSAVGREVSEAFFTVAGAAIDRVTELVANMRGQPVGAGELEPFTGSLLAWYRDLAPGSLERARELVTRSAARMTAFLAEWDVTLCPTVGAATPELGFLAPDLPRETILRRTESLAGYTAAHNMAGAPAMSVPLHVDDAGLPVGCQFAAPAGHDARLLALAYELESAAPWAERWPTLTATPALSSPTTTGV